MIDGLGRETASRNLSPASDHPFKGILSTQHENFRDRLLHRRFRRTLRGRRTRPFGLAAQQPGGARRLVRRRARVRRGGRQNIDSMHSFMLVRHGHVVAEGWWSPYDAETPHSLYSLSKSFTSTAVGLAIAEGKLSLDDEVLKFFPDDAPAEPSNNLKAMRVSDLLRMSTGHQTEPPRTAGQGLDQDLPGASRCRSSPARISSTTRRRPTCSRPSSRRRRARRCSTTCSRGSSSRWASSTRPGRPARRASRLGGYGLSIRTEDIAKFGQLYLQKGKWHGKQLVPAVVGRGGHRPPDLQRQQPEERLGPGLRLPVLAHAATAPIAATGRSANTASSCPSRMP